MSDPLKKIKAWKSTFTGDYYTMTWQRELKPIEITIEAKAMSDIKIQSRQRPIQRCTLIVANPTPELIAALKEAWEKTEGSK